MKSFFSISFRYLKENVKRTVLTIIGIVLSVSLFSGIFNMALSYRDVKIENAKKMSGNYMVKYIGVNYKTAKKITENAEVLNSGFKETPAEGVVYNGTKTTDVSVFSYSPETFKDILNKYFNIKKGRLPQSSDETLKMCSNHILSGSADKNKLNDMGVILINRNKISEGKSSPNYVDFSTYKVGDKITVPQFMIVPQHEDNSKETDSVEKQIKNEIDNKKFYTFTVVRIIDSDVITKENPENGLGLVFSEDMYKKIFKNEGYNTFWIKFKDKKASEESSSYFISKAQSLNGNYVDRFKIQEEEKNGVLQMQVIFYGFLAIIALIGIVNIINTLFINIMMRKREFATLKAVGMTEGQVTKMVILEGISYSIIASAIGILTGFGLSEFLCHK